ncbi:MAG: hypothetical protein ACRDRN_15815 [Sciscionella sp.]
MQPDSDAAAERCPATVWRRAVIGVIIGACTVGTAWLATAAARGVSGADSFTLHGTMSLRTNYHDVTSVRTGCRGSGGYADISDGTAVTVYNANDAVIATGDLENATSNGNGCESDIQVPGVPAGNTFYQVEVSHRGKITVSAHNAESGKVAVSLGN